MSQSLKTLSTSQFVTPEKAPRKLYIESYGCAMNFSDSEIIAAIMNENGFENTQDEMDADVVLLNTCAIRDNAEQKIRHRLMHLKRNKREKPHLIVGVLGCMAERLKDQLLEEEKLVDLVAGPDSYRDLPKLVAEVDDGARAINVILSKEETYADLSPVRLNSNGVTAFISIMRGCDNMCSFCVVPYTRGRERSRDPKTIIDEALELQSNGYREITLLGQNVDSYLWFGGGPKKEFKKLSEQEQESSVNFAELIEIVAQAVPNMRIRFSTSHPRDIDAKVIHTMAKYQNICNSLHFPVQSGSSRVLDLMNRNYTREWYLDKINMVRSIIPNCHISTDLITGFCTETEAEHNETLTLMREANFCFAYMYKYSERPGTPAAKKLEDNISEEEKSRRLSEIIVVQNELSAAINAKFEGEIIEVLVEGEAKRGNEDWKGRSEENIKVVFPKGDFKIGDIVKVKVIKSNLSTLIGQGIDLVTN
jgi:tRNA-2-methylthio-N6-dimethylallyladenosine synthase